MNRDVEILILRATPLVFGVLGQTYGADGQRIVRVGGSGIFVAPFQALTARHVSRDLFRSDPARADELNRRTPGYFETPHSSNLFQTRDPFGNEPRPLFWCVRRTWDPAFTDICSMEVFAYADEAGGMERQMTGFFEWALVPPPVGSHVVMLGYPKTKIATNGNLMKINVNYVLQEGQITDVYQLKRDSGLLPFPCFRIDKPVDEGFSGGPVFWEDKLCGIVSAGSLDGSTYAASLWPLCLLEYEYPDLGTLGAKRVFGELFEFGVLRSQDWRHIKDRIAKQHDAEGKPYATIRPPG